MGTRNNQTPWNDHALEMVVPYISNIRGLVMLFHTNKHMSGLMEDRESHMRGAFIQTVTRLTAYPSKGFFPDQVSRTLKQVQGRKDFFQHIRALICPWTTVGKAVPIRDLSTELSASRILTVREAVGDLVISSPLVAGKHFSVKILENGTSCVSRLCTPLKPEPEEGKLLVQNPQVFYEKIQDLLYEPLDMKEFGFHKRDGQRFSFFPIHGCVFAVIASYDGLDCDRVAHHEAGIYFFSMPSGEMLSHRIFPVSATNFKSFIQSRPFHMWILTKRILFHMDGPKSVYNPDMVRVSTPEDRIHNAMYMVSQGNLEKALHFMSTRISNASLDTRARHNRRSLLHYAAYGGHGDTVEKLLDMKCDPFPLDNIMVSPLQLAVRGYHHECVCLLACGVIIPTVIWESSWAELCSGVTMTSAFRGHSDKIRGYCRTSIPEITRILWNNRPPMDWGAATMHLARATRSYAILSSKDALEFVLRQNIAPDTPFPMNRFASGGGFKFLMATTLNKEHDEEMVRSMRNAVINLGMDVNCPAGGTNEGHLVWAVRHGSPEAVRVLVEELGADVMAGSATGVPIFQVALTRLVSRPGIEAAEKVMHYVNRILNARQNAQVAGGGGSD